MERSNAWKTQNNTSHHAHPRFGDPVWGPSTDRGSSHPVSVWRCSVQVGSALSKLQLSSAHPTPVCLIHQAALLMAFILFFALCCNQQVLGKTQSSPSRHGIRMELNGLWTHKNFPVDYLESFVFWTNITVWKLEICLLFLCSDHQMSWRYNIV